MPVGALLTNHWSGTLYDGHPKSSSKGEKTTSRLFSEIASDFMNSEKEGESNDKQAIVNTKAPLLYSRRITANIKTEEVTTEYTRSTFTNNDSSKLDTVFYTYYSRGSIKCIREGERNPENPEEKTGEDRLQWEIKLDSKEQYDKVMSFLEEFPKEDNLRFTANEKFWNDFLRDKIDMDGFRDFYAWTDGGEPHMGKGENGESAGINKERLQDPNAEYFNDQTWIGHVWTEEEMWAEWYSHISSSAEAETDQQFIHEYIQELLEKIKNGDTEESFQIGGSSFTLKEWDEFLEKFDSVEDAVKKLLEELIEKRIKAEQEAGAENNNFTRNAFECHIGESLDLYVR